MIAVKIICVGKLKEKFYSQAVDELTKRLSRYCKLEIAEITDREGSRTALGYTEGTAKGEGGQAHTRKADRRGIPHCDSYRWAIAFKRTARPENRCAHDGGKEQIGICHRRVAGSVRRGVKARGL